jgi:hypothetical protein
MTLGQAVISELGRRGQRGMYFDFKGSCHLRRVRTAGELKTFLSSQDFQQSPVSSEASVVADFLQEEAKKRQIKKTSPFLVLDGVLAIVDLFCPFSR